MIGSMTADPSEWGPRLYAHVDAHLRAAGLTVNAWADAHPGVGGPTLSRWRDGVTPRLETMLPVAAALGETILDLLVVAGVVDPDDPRRDAPTIEAALRGDPGLSDLERTTMTQILAALRKAELEVSAQRGRIRV